MLAKKEKESESFVVDLSPAFSSPLGKRVQTSISLVRRAVKKRFDASEVRIDPDINSKLWARSRSKPPRHIKIKVSIVDEVAHAELG